MSTSPTTSPTTAVATTADKAIVRTRAFLEARKGEIQKVAAGSLTPDRLFRIVLSAIAKTPALQDCTVESIYGCVHQSAQLGLELGNVLGHAYMVPYRDNKKDVTVAQFIPGWRGLVFLAVTSGAAKSIEAHVVRENDEFELVYGSEPRLHHRPALSGTPSKAIGAYALAKLPDGERLWIWMSTAEIEAVRARSKAAQSGPWVTDWDEMASKTTIRRLVKRLPLSEKGRDAVGAALEAEDASVIDIQVAPAREVPATRTEAVKAKLGIGTTAPPAAKEPAASASPADAQTASVADAFASVEGEAAAPAATAEPVPDHDPAEVLKSLGAMATANGTPESKALAAETKRLAGLALRTAGVPKIADLNRAQLNQLYVEACAARERIAAAVPAGGAA